MKKYDFAGWATKNDVTCADGVTIKKDAFKSNDDQKVPLMWQHSHNQPENVLGYVKLKNKPEGVYAYGYFNDSKNAQEAKAALNHGDINALSIGAHKLKKQANNVLHGIIYEVSLVLAGANPGAYVEHVINHSDGEEDSSRIIVHTDNLLHSAEDVIPEDLTTKETTKGDYTNMDATEINEILEGLTDEQELAVNAYLKHSIEAELTLPEDATPEQIIDSLSDQQAEFIAELLAKDEGEEGEGTEGEEGEEGEVTHSIIGGNKMKRNLFTSEGVNVNNDELIHSIDAIIADGFANQTGTLRENIKKSSNTELEHGITNIEVLFPEAQTLTPTPTIYKDRQTNAIKILDKVTKSPLSRVKAWQADFTEDEARARGYIKGNEKIEQIFEVISRSVSPQTIYKKQGIDRDDIIDVKFDVVPFLNAEMQMMLREEIARALLVGDGRPETVTVDGKPVKNPDKIYPDKIIPVMEDKTLYTIALEVNNISEMMEQIILVLGEYQGSGVPDLYINPQVAAKLRLMKTGTGAYLFGPIPSLPAVAAAMGVNEIIPTSFLKEKEFAIVNLTDYTLGASKGGEISNFDDFDIDFNKYKYLIETRLSGMLTVLKSAVRGTIKDVSTPGIVTMKVEQGTTAPESRNVQTNAEGQTPAGK